MADVPRPCACTTVRRASRVLARAFDAALEPARLNVTQLAVLRAVRRHEGEPLTRVAEDLSMDRTSLYRAVAALQGKGWVAVSEGPTARSRSARITARGARLLDGADPHWARIQTDIVSRFGTKRWAALAEELGALAAIAREAIPEGKDTRE